MPSDTKAALLEKALPYKYHSCHSLSVLLCICFLTFGSYWVYDTPGAIFSQLQTWFGGESNYSSYQNLLLYSVYSWPNIVLAFFGGYIIDRVTGVRAGTIFFTSLIAAGQTMFAVGVQLKIYWLCVVGRLVFGLGGESLTVAQNTYVIRWFEGPDLALIFGLVVAFARIGSSVNFAVTPILAKSGVPLSVWFGAAMCGFSLLVCFLGACLDKTGEHILNQRKEDIRAEKSLISDTDSDNGSDAGEQAPSIMAVRKFPLRAWILFLNCMIFYNAVLTFYAVASDIMQNIGPYYDNYARLPDENSHSMCTDYNSSVPSYYTKPIDSNFSCESECNALPTCSGYQLDVADCLWFTPEVVLNGSTYSHGTFVQGSSNAVSASIAQSGSMCFKRGHQFSAETSTLFMSIPNFVAIFASPLFGRLVDKKGFALNWIMTASLMLIIAHLVFLANALDWFFVHPIIIMLWLGFAYSLGAAAIWPIASLIVPRALVGTAYGCMTSVQNFGLAIFPMIIGALQGMDGIKGTNWQYVVPIVIFICCAGLSFVLAFLNLILDRQAGNGASIMNASAAQKQAIQEQQEREAREGAVQANL